jgi:hypothetical protein
MQTYRAYPVDSGSIIAAEMVEVASHGDAYPWAGKLTPTRLEVWQGATFHRSAPVA